jgi:hypothetical protein
MSKRNLLLVISVLIVAVIAVPAYRLGEWFGAYPVQYLRVGRPSYSKARSVADSFMAQTPGAPWDYLSGSFVLDFDGTLTGAPTWVFRYQNPKTGQKSIRIYVRIPEYKVRYTAIGLDALPVHGTLPR